MSLGNPNGGLANGGLARKAPIGPKRALSGQFLLFPRGPEKAPIWPEKARLSRKELPPIFSENLGLKPPFVSPVWIFPIVFPKSLSETPFQPDRVSFCTPNKRTSRQCAASCSITRQFATFYDNRRLFLPFDTKRHKHHKSS